MSPEVHSLTSLLTGLERGRFFLLTFAQQLCHLEFGLVEEGESRGKRMGERRGDLGEGLAQDEKAPPVIETTSQDICLGN